MARKKQVSDNSISLSAKLEEMFGDSIEPERVCTGCDALDLVLGGGLPRGRVIEHASEEGIGKTTLWLGVCRHLAQSGYRTVYMDMEHAVNESQLNGLGLNSYRYSAGYPDGLFQIIFPNSADELDKSFETLLSSGDDDKPCMVVIDSVDMFLPEKYLADVKITDPSVAIKSRVQTNFFHKYKAALRKSGISVILINQMRVKIRFTGESTVEAASGYGLRHYSDVRLLMEKRELHKIKRQTIRGIEEIPYIMTVDLWAQKNKHASPFIRVPLGIVFGKGFSNSITYMWWLMSEGYLVKDAKGAYYRLSLNDEEKAFCGWKAVYDYCRENIGMLREFVNNHGGLYLVREV